MGTLKTKIRKKLFSVMSDKTIDRFYRVYYRVRYPKEMQKKCSFGSHNPDKTFYVIRPRTDCTEGLMSLFMNVAKNMHFAYEHNYEPIIDFENYQTQYIDNSRSEKNVWEYYFTQPTKYTLKEIYQSKNVILSGLNIQWYKPALYEVNFSDDILRQLHDDIFTKIKFSNDVMRATKEEISKIGLNLTKTLALYLRGTDYIKLKPSGHPVQPTVEQAVEVVEKYLNQYDIEKIFLITEDGEIYEKIKSKYGDKCVITSSDTFIKNYDGKDYISHHQSINDLGNSPYQRGLNYLIKLIILSECEYFIGGNTMGSWAACAFAEQPFKAKYVFDLGMYGK